jgi:hypothetical protein
MTDQLRPVDDERREMTPEELADQEMSPVDGETGMTPEELSDQEASELPDRENMSLVNANVAAPINLAAALNVLSDNSTAQAIAIQNAPIDQDT